MGRCGGARGPVANSQGAPCRQAILCLPSPPHGRGATGLLAAITCLQVPFPLPVKRPLPVRAPHAQGAAASGQWEWEWLEGRYISQGWWVPEYLSSMEWTNWLH